MGFPTYMALKSNERASARKAMTILKNRNQDHSTKDEPTEITSMWYWHRNMQTDQ
jgi:hypothetical protein